MPASTEKCFNVQETRPRSGSVAAGRFRAGRPSDRAGPPRGVDHSVKACFPFSFIAVREAKTVLKYSAEECAQVFRVVFELVQEHATRREALRLTAVEKGCAHETSRSWMRQIGSDWIAR